MWEKLNSFFNSSPVIPMWLLSISNLTRGGGGGGVSSKWVADSLMGWGGVGLVRNWFPLTTM